MATALSNLFSFLLPSKPPPPPRPPPPPLPKLPPPHHLQAQKPRHGLDPLVAQEAYYSSSSSELSSVICPSLAYSNTLFFRSAYNVQVIVDDNEPEERLLNRFRREVMKVGLIQECKRRRFFESTQDEKKRKSSEAAKRNKRRRSQARSLSQDKPEASPNKKEEGEEDNWDVLEGDLPY